MTFGIDSGHLWVLFGAALFGVIYNQGISWLRRNGYDEGYTALLVAGGVIITLALAAFLIGAEAAILVLLVFVCSGVPMIVGSIGRYVVARRRELGQ